MKKLTASIFSAVLMLSMVFSSSVFAANDATQASAWESFVGLFTKATTTATTANVQYRGHVEDYGDVPTNGTWVTEDNQLGTTGESKRIEGFKIELTDGNTLPAGTQIRYNVHIQNEGWQHDPDDIVNTSSWAKNGEFAGSVAKSQRVEAIEIVLTDANGVKLEGYSVQYMVHVENIGWDQGWVSDGALAGTTAKSYRLEAIRIKIVQTKADLTQYNAALAAVTQADYTTASWTTYQGVVNANKVTADNTQTQVNTATANITAAQGNLVLVPKVTSVTALNAKQIAVTYNQAVQSGIATGGAQVAANYNLGITTNHPTRIEMSSDNTTATLTFAAGFVSTLNTYQQFAVTGVKSATGTTIADYKTSLLLQDKTAPSASASYIAPTAKITFSEPMKADADNAPTALGTTATVVVDGVVNTGYAVIVDNTASDTVSGVSAITMSGLSTGTHRIDIVGAKDLAGNFLPDYTATINTLADTTAPTVTSLTSEGSKIRIKFSEAVQATTLNAQASKVVWLQVGAVNVYGVLADAVDTTNTEFLISADAFVTGGGTWVNAPVVVKAGTQDLSGNAIASALAAKNLIITLDTTPPTVSSVTTSGDKIIVKFNEAIQAGSSAITTADVKFTGTDGVVHDITAATVTPAYVYDANNNGVTTDAGENQYLVLQVTAPSSIVASSQLAAGTYAVTLPAAAVSDKATTPNDTTVASTLKFTVGSSATTTNNLACTPSQVASTPGVLEFAYVVTGSATSVSDAALEPANYTINGTSLPSNTKLYFYGDKFTVRAELPTGTISVSGNRTIAVANVTDANGNTLNDASSLTGTLVSILENVKPVAQSAAFIDGTNISVQMSEAIASPAGATGIEVYVNGTKIDTATNALTFAKAAGTNGVDTQLTITATNASTFAPGQTIVVKFVDGSTVADTVGNTITIGQVTVQ